jgi:hypothetical protein
VALGRGLILLFILSASRTLAMAQYVESFETPEKTWRMADHDCTVNLQQHARVYGQAHAGQACEYLQFRAGTGTFAHLIHDIPASRVIGELNISLWIKSNRPGLQLAARVILPRSKDPRTGAPLTALIRGNSYSQAGVWQKLTLDQVDLLVSRQLPLLRSQLAADVSDREAYIDLVVLNGYGGTGQSEIWIDDLEVACAGSTDISPVRTPGEPPPETAVTSSSAISSSVTDPPQNGPAAQDQSARDQSTISLGGRPRLVRAIDYNGEPFAYLKSLGFHAVRLLAPPTPTQLQEAEASEMRLIVPPPLGNATGEPSADEHVTLAWDLGDSVTTELLEPTRRLATQLQAVPDSRRRPMLCLPREGVWHFSRLVDLIVLEPPCPQSSLPLEQLGDWYLQRARLMRPGTPFWASIRTQMHPSIREQMQAFGDTSPVSATLEPEQIQLLTYHAIASGARGLWFRSESRLDATDRQTQLRAKALEYLNLELQRIEAWAATGTHESEIATSDPTVRASLLKTDRSRLLVVIRKLRDQQYIAGREDARPITLEISGVPTTDEAYLIGETGLQRLRHERNAGMLITLPPPAQVSLVVLTQDSLAVNFLAMEINKTRPRRDALAGEIAANVYTSVVETSQQLQSALPVARSSDQDWNGSTLSQARSALQHYERLTTGGGHERAEESLQRGLQLLASARYEQWSSIASAFPMPVASPLCVSYHSLPQHLALSQKLRTATWGPNALAGGDLENLQHLQSAGWRNLTSLPSEMHTRVELSLHNPRSGRSSLRIQCWPAQADQAPPVIESPPMSIVSGPVSVRAGQVVRIHGWARVPERIQGSLDGLLIFDSIAGRALAARLDQSPDWQEFTLYRAIPRDTSLTLTFALSGMGEAWLDEVTVNALDLPLRQARANTP